MSGEHARYERQAAVEEINSLQRQVAAKDLIIECQAADRVDEVERFEDAIEALKDSITQLSFSHLGVIAERDRLKMQLEKMNEN